MFVVCCLGSGVCDGLITRSEESYGLCVCVCVCVCLIVCDVETIENEAAWSRVELLDSAKINMKSDDGG